MKNVKYLLVALLLCGVAGVLMAGSCEDVTEAACGPCGKVENGDATITGMAQLDGLFKAVGDLKLATGSINADFDGQVRAMAEGVFGIDVSAMTTAQVVAAIKAEFDTQIKANLEGEISVKYEPPKCSANVNVAVEAKAQCSAKMDASCDAEVKCDPGKISVECSGKCEGSCSAGCEAPVCEVKLTPGEANCSGECSGSCTAKLDVAAACSGKCEGTCSGTCSSTNGDGQCEGTCDGDCQGSCTMEGEAALNCTGSCSGGCKVKGPDAEVECEGELKCEGKCSGECSGGCQGEAKAPKCEGKASCEGEASADCEAQASAQASAKLECTPPSLELDYGFQAGLTAEAKADLIAKLEGFKAGMIGVAQGTAKLRALVDAKYAADLGITSPTVSIKASIQSFASAVANGDIEFTAPGLLVCAAPAFETAGNILVSLPGEMKATINLQLSMLTMIGQ